MEFGTFGRVVFTVLACNLFGVGIIPTPARAWSAVPKLNLAFP